MQNTQTFLSFDLWSEAQVEIQSVNHLDMLQAPNMETMI